MATNSTKANAVLGTMTFGTRGSSAKINTPELAKQAIDIFTSFGHTHVDTARMYGLGSSEELLGDLNLSQSHPSVTIASKSWPNVPGDHSPEKLRATVLEALAALKTDRIPLFYLHKPDVGTPFKDTLAELDKLVKEGKIGEIGLSNFSAWQVAEVVNICRQNGYTVPTVYQGLYSALGRDVETEVIPALRFYGLRFYAYNVLCGGILANDYKFDEVPTESGGRFSADNNLSANYRKRYWKKAFFDAMENIRSACAAHNISATEAALRWMAHHSKLDYSKGDAVIIGASRPVHLTDNLQNLGKGPLPDDVVSAFNDGWRITMPDSEGYIRTNTGAHPIASAMAASSDSKQ
ncbi:keto reductase [Ramicandelaber brevisporus]|nr:keto reductase [Ramicandelaber brevisporus]